MALDSITTFVDAFEKAKIHAVEALIDIGIEQSRSTWGKPEVPRTDWILLAVKPLV
jgi:hypothetical protein